MNNDLNKEAVVDTKRTSTVSEKKKTAAQGESARSTPKKRPAQNTTQTKANVQRRSAADGHASDKHKKPTAQKSSVKKTSSSAASTSVKKPVKKAAPSKADSHVSSESLSNKKDIDSTTKAKATKKKRKLKKPFAVAFPIVAAAIILSAGVAVSSAALGIFKAEKHEAFIATKQSNVDLSSPTGKFLEGISVQGIDLGGMTMTEAQDILRVAESELIPSINYSLTCNDKIVYLTEDDFEFDFDTVKILNEAFEYSQYLRSILTDDGRTALRSSEKKDYSITMTFNEDYINDVCEEVAKKVNVEMQDAHVTSIDTSKEEVADMFSFAECVTGHNLDIEDLKTQINTLRNNGQFTANIIGQMEDIEPTIDLKNLKENFVLISQYKTYSGNTWEGNMNMKTAMASMTGSIIKPGEVFSFNEKTGNSNLEENGYYMAGVITNGQSAEGIGGGICQAATTIYNAAVRAGMTIVERMPHTWPSVYVPVGIDSAIDYGNIDLKLRNDSEHEMYLICYMESTTLYSFIYGYKPSDFDEILVSSWYTSDTESESGFNAAASRSYYKDGELVKTEELPNSHYSAGGGKSYPVNEQLSGYVFQRVFTDERIADDEKKAQESDNYGEYFDSDEDSDSTDSSDSSNSLDSDEEKSTDSED